MTSLLQSAVYLGGGMVVLGLLVLPVLFLLTVSALYLMLEAVQYFSGRRGVF